MKKDEKYGVGGFLEPCLHPDSFTRFPSLRVLLLCSLA